MKYRTKAFEIDAVNIDDQSAVEPFAGDKVRYLTDADRINADDPEAVAEVFDTIHSTWILVLPGQFIIKGMKGEFYPCDPEVFHSKYEAISNWENEGGNGNHRS